MDPVWRLWNHSQRHSETRTQNWPTSYPNLHLVLAEFWPICGPFGLKVIKYLHAEHETNTEFSDSSFGMTNELHWPTQYLFLIVRGRQPWCLIDIFSFLASHQSFGISFSERPKYSHLALESHQIHYKPISLVSAYNETTKYLPVIKFSDGVCKMFCFNISSGSGFVFLFFLRLFFPECRLDSPWISI